MWNPVFPPYLHSVELTTVNHGTDLLTTHVKENGSILNGV